MNWKLILSFISMVVDFFTALLEKGHSKEVIGILSALKSSTTAALIRDDKETAQNG